MLMAGRDEAIIYMAMPSVTKNAKRSFLPRQGKGRWAKIVTPRAVNVSARRRGCANSPVEPAAIQAAAREAIAATTGPNSADVSSG